MNAQECAVALDLAIALGIWGRPADESQLRDQIVAWSMVLADVPANFAERQIRTHSGPYSIRPSLIRGAWEQEEKASRERERGRYDERACAHARDCRCDHLEGVCNRGFLEERDGPPVEWCPRCWDARNIARDKAGKDPRPVGVVGP